MADAPKRSPRLPPRWVVVSACDERDRLWDRWREMGDDLDGYAIRRPSGTAVVVLEPRSAAGP